MTTSYAFDLALIHGETLWGQVAPLLPGCNLRESMIRAGRAHRYLVVTFDGAVSGTITKHGQGFDVSVLSDSEDAAATGDDLTPTLRLAMDRLQARIEAADTTANAASGWI